MHLFSLQSNCTLPPGLRTVQYYLPIVISWFLWPGTAAIWLHSLLRNLWHNATPCDAQRSPTLGQFSHASTQGWRLVSESRCKWRLGWHEVLLCRSVRLSRKQASAPNCNWRLLRPSCALASQLPALERPQLLLIALTDRYHGPSTPYYCGLCKVA